MVRRNIHVRGSDSCRWLHIMPRALSLHVSQSLTDRTVKSARNTVAHVPCLGTVDLFPWPSHSQQFASTPRPLPPHISGIQGSDYAQCDALRNSVKRFLCRGTIVPQSNIRDGMVIATRASIHRVTGPFVFPQSTFSKHFSSAYSFRTYSAVH